MAILEQDVDVKDDVICR